MCFLLFIILGIVVVVVAWSIWGWVAGVVVIALMCAPFLLAALRIFGRGRWASSSGGGKGGLFRYSDNRKKAHERWLAAQDKPVGEWKRCPACEAELGDDQSLREEHLVVCESCERLFTDPGYVPGWDVDYGPTGEVVEAAGRTAEEVKHADTARPWITFRAEGESSHVTGIILMLDHELVYGTAVAFDE